MLHSLKVNWKIAILSSGIVLFSLLIAGIVLVGTILSLKEEELGRRLVVTARTVAQLPEVIDGLTTREEPGRIQAAAERIRIINDVTYVVVMDMNRVRLSHPVDAQIGVISQGEDEASAFAEHTYISKAEGEAGTVIRAFVPIMDRNHVQVGVALVGRLVPSVTEVIQEVKGPGYLILLISLLFGIWGSWKLARHIKRQMFQLEPTEIAKLLVERTATFNAMHEGVIAIDNKERITIINERAKQLLGVRGEADGRPIREVLPDTRLPEILEMNHPVYNKELVVGSARILSNRVPIKVGEQTVGAVAIFRDRSEVTRMAEELTGVKAFVDALRVQNHEYMNKLHTIGGLIQLDKKEKALDYLFEITEEKEALTRFLSQNIRDEHLSGLLLGKISRGRELGIQVIIDRNSRFERIPEPLTHHDFVVIVGNLIENAFDAFQGLKSDPTLEKRIDISIEQDDEVLSVLVEDNGRGMPEGVRKRIFERGFTTKSGESRGIGLFLIQELIQKGNGTIEVRSELGRGTSFLITFPMHEKEDGGSAEE